LESPITDRTLGIKPSQSDKFREVRAKASDEYVERCNKKKKKPIIITPIPLYFIGDRVVVDLEREKSQYLLVEIIDFREAWEGYFYYYGIILKVTEKEMVDKIGRIYHFGENGYSRMRRSEEISENKIKWTD